ncbi:MAG: hypothetical protein WBN77_11600 [Desulfobacterales bacterium]
MEEFIWTFEDSSWEQDDSSQSFKIRSLFGQKCNTDPVAPLSMLVGAKNHPALGVHCEKGGFPPDFNNCPYCGAKLLNQNNIEADLWLPPYGTGNGLKLFPIKLTLNKKIEAHNKIAIPFPLPSRDGHFAFCSTKLGAQQRLLVAVQRDTGQLWVFRPSEGKKWEVLAGNAGGDTLPAWSWSLSVDSSESGLCLPCDQGPVWLTVNWASNNIQVDRAIGRSVGGAIRVGKYLLAPVLREDSFVIVSRKEGDRTWSDCSSTSDPAVVLTQLLSSSGQNTCLGIPVLDENRQIAYWPGRGGYIRAFGVNPSGVLSWEFKPWETDEYPAVALIELGPPYRKTGSRPGFWQLCEDRDRSVRDGIVNKIIKIDGDERIDSENVECGQFVTTGRASFSWSDDYWDDIHKRNPRISEQSELRFPLLQFGEKGLALIAKVSPWEGRDELGLFSEIFFNHDLKTTTFVRFVIEGSGVPEKALYAEGVDGVHGGNAGSLFRVGLSQLPEISAFIYESSLYIYFPEKNDCYTWSLEILEG